jgi:phage N-6-adenine-methyltransferase
MNTAVLFSSAKDDWQTPLPLFARLHEEFDFTLDAAATRANTLCDFFYGHGSPIVEDALSVDWPSSDRIWCNPPYSKQLQRQFIQKAAEAGKRGGCVVMLIPARTDTKAFHAHIWCAQTHGPRPGIEVRFLPGRIKFVGAKHGAPFPSMIVVFRGV